MGKSRRRGSRSEKAGSRGAGVESGARGIRLSKVEADRAAERRDRLGGIAAYVGYMVAVWLVAQSANTPASEPVFGYRWSPALLGAVVALATALLRNEHGLRMRLWMFDQERAGRLVYSVAWSVLALIGMAAAITIPRY